MADQKCPPCKAGAPLWMATFSDMVTLLLTFFVLLLSFAKTETAKYEAAMGSLRSAFGGNVLKPGDVMRPGKSPDDAPTMIDSDQPVRPFPIEFLTSEGLLDKHEVNRESDEQLVQIKKLLKDYDLTNNVNVFEVSEGIIVKLKEKIYFKSNSIAIEDINIQIFEKLINLLKENAWHIMIEGHASRNESQRSDELYEVSSKRAMAVSKTFLQRGISPERISTTFYGASRPQDDEAGINPNNRRVEFIIRKRDFRSDGKKVIAE